MEKAIKLVMDDKKNIKIFLNEQEIHIIEAQNRIISAEKIYEIFNFETGDYYTVLSENKKNLDNQVLEFFKEVFTDIKEKINEISTNH